VRETHDVMGGTGGGGERREGDTELDWSPGDRVHRGGWRRGATAGYRVRCLVRPIRRGCGATWLEQVEVVAGDAAAAPDVPAAMAA